MSLVDIGLMLNLVALCVLYVIVFFLFCIDLLLFCYTQQIGKKKKLYFYFYFLSKQKHIKVFYIKYNLNQTLVYE